MCDIQVYKIGTEELIQNISNAVKFTETSTGQITDITPKCGNKKGNDIVKLTGKFELESKIYFGVSLCNVINETVSEIFCTTT